jgi:thiamine-phosphate pyrophosphorylase
MCLRRLPSWSIYSCRGGARSSRLPKIRAGLVIIMSPERQRVLCLITDRRRLAAAIGAASGDSERCLLDQIAGAVSGGVDVVQIRERDLEGRALAVLTRRCVALAAGSSTQVVVNDRLDIALATGAAGVHLREDSMPIEAANRVGGSLALIGRSIHGVDAARAGRAASYLIAGSVFPTDSKQGRVLLGLEGLRQIIHHSGGCPVWAVGGITRERLRSIIEAGANGIAAIGAFIPSGPGLDLARRVQNLASELRFSFDSSAGPP